MVAEVGLDIAAELQTFEFGGTGAARLAAGPFRKQPNSVVPSYKNSLLNRTSQVPSGARVTVTTAESASGPS
jgi:hypothetical protein